MSTVKWGWPNVGNNANPDRPRRPTVVRYTNGYERSLSAMTCVSSSDPVRAATKTEMP